MWALAQTLIYYFLKEQIRFRFLPWVCFWQFKYHNSGKKMETKQMTPFFSSTFWALTFCDIHFCNWKLSKFIFMGSHLCSILVCKIPEFWRWKLWDQNFVPFGLGNIHNKESKKPGFNFSIELKAKLCLI